MCYTSRKCGKAFEINRRVVLGMATIGKGLQALESLCTDLNMPPPMTADVYKSTLDKVTEAVVEESEASMQSAAALEHDLGGAAVDTIMNCKAMFDGTWRKRGHSSLQGGVTGISVESGKCLDYEPLNKICKGCAFGKKLKVGTDEYENWVVHHKTVCARNYEGSAPSMEPTGALRMFQRSVTKKQTAIY